MVLKRALGGLTLVAVGLILLANTTGYLPWSVWLTILALWPLLLVAAGIDVLGRSLDNEWLRALGSLVVLAGLVYGALAGQGSVPVLGAPFVRTGPAATFDLSKPRGEAVRTGTARIAVGPSNFVLGPDRQGALVSVRGRSPFGAPALTVEESGELAAVSVGQPEGGQLRIGPANGFDMAVGLSPAVEWRSVEAKLGLTRSSLDLGVLLVDRLQVDAGLSSTDIVLGPPHPGRPQEVLVSGGLSGVRIRVPDVVAAEAEIDNGLGSTTLGPGWQRVSGDGGHSVWRTFPGSGSPALRIVVRTGLSSVAISSYRFTGPAQPL